MDKVNLRRLDKVIIYSSLPFVTISITTIILLILRDNLSTTTIALIYLLTVIINTTYRGLRLGIISAILAFLAYNFFFLLPYYTFVVHQSQDIIALVIFLIVAILVSQLVGRANKNLAESIARERELTNLYEFSLALTSVTDINEIAQVIASHAIGMFQGSSVRVSVKPVFGEVEFDIHVPAQETPPTGQPHLVAPLETARGVLGEIQIWRQAGESDPAETRILHTFSFQAAIALERAILALAETRARVLEESNRLKTALLSSVSHELRTPLSTIKAAITSLLSDEVGWDTLARKDLLSAVDEETDQLNHLVGNLLDMSRIETGALRPNRQWNLLPEIVDGVVQRMHRILRDHRINIDIPDELPLVPVDYIQMEQVFSNLLSNSAKYAPKGSAIQIIVTPPDPEKLLIQVTNEGPQIAPEHLDRIFDKFYRLGFADNVSGTGLGLSICKGIVQAHGGSIWVENLPDGIAFKFILPTTLDGMPPPVIETESL